MADRGTFSGINAAYPIVNADGTPTRDFVRAFGILQRILASGADNIVDAILNGDVQLSIDNDDITEPVSVENGGTGLDAIAADQMWYGTGPNAVGLTALTAQGRALLDDASFAAMRATLDITLANLLDVNVPAPADGQALVYDDSTGKWVPGAASGGGGAGAIAAPIADYLEPPTSSSSYAAKGNIYEAEADIVMYGFTVGVGGSGQTYKLAVCLVDSSSEITEVLAFTDAISCDTRDSYTFLLDTGAAVSTGERVAVFVVRADSTATAVANPGFPSDPGPDIPGLRYVSSVRYATLDPQVGDGPINVDGLHVESSFIYSLSGISGGGAPAAGDSFLQFLAKTNAGTLWDIGGGEYFEVGDE